MKLFNRQIISIFCRSVGIDKQEEKKRFAGRIDEYIKKTADWRNAYPNVIEMVQRCAISLKAIYAIELF